MVDRAVSIDLLSRALGPARARLPGPEELQAMLLGAELSLFVRDEATLGDALASAWILHGRAMSSGSLDDTRDVGAAAAVSAHVFDLALQQSNQDDDLAHKYRVLLAAQSAYMVAGLAPNAMAVARGRLADPPPDMSEAPGLAAMHAASLLLQLDMVGLTAFLTDAEQQAADLMGGWGELDTSPYQAMSEVLAGLRLLQTYLIGGDVQALEAGQERFQAAVMAPFATFDTDSRWTAALLLEFGEAARSSSVWSVLPPDVPTVPRALLHGAPPVALLWPPQAEFFRSTPSPFEVSTRRMVLSMPTSAGKTLMAQAIVIHAIEATNQDACIVAPTHALCREIAADLNTRLDVVGKRAVDASYGSVDTSGARVVVTTPERLGAALRADPLAVIERFGIVAVDEAHLVAEAGRGQQLEHSLSLLHDLTKDVPDFRLLLISAALGDGAQLSTWIRVGEPPAQVSIKWRGPRRLHGIYSTAFEGEPVLEPQVGRRLPRRVRKLAGEVFLRRPDGVTLTGRFEGSAGLFVQRMTRSGTWNTDGERSTKQILRMAPLLDHLLEDRANDVLVVVAQRREAREVASQVAAMLPLSDDTAGLADRLADRLGAGHALVELVRHGVAFHHGLLPRDVQVEIEAAAQQRRIRCLVATSTLTEGVNLPFRSVVVASTGWGSGDARTEIIDPPRLLNAFGRAGRACRETEGWLFMALNERVTADSFDVFAWEPGDGDLRSRLASDQALAELAEFEMLRAAGVDALLQPVGDDVDEFVAFVWLAMDVLARMSRETTFEGLVSLLSSTLAWQQLDPDDRERWQELARISLERYEAAEAEQRRRWGRSGLRLSSSATIDALSVDLAQAVSDRGSEPSTQVEWIDVLMAEGRLARWLAMPENPVKGPFKPYPSAPASKALSVDVEALVRRWVDGDELADIGDELLAEIDDADHRADVLSEWAAGVLENHLPRVIALTIDWAEERLPGRIGAASGVVPMIRFGVSTSSAVHLMMGGVRSRRLANRIGNALGHEDAVATRRLLGSMTIETWRQEFGASPAEVADLLTFVADPSEQLVSEFFDAGATAVPCMPSRDDLPEGIVVVRRRAFGAQAGISLTRDGVVVAEVPTTLQVHVDAILRLGLPIAAYLERGADDAWRLRLTAQRPGT
jgi:hypothetical protein